MADSICIPVYKQEGGVLFIKIKMNTSFGRLMDAYSTHQGGRTSTHIYMFDGVRISRTDTPEKLGMKADDFIEVVNGQTGGA